MTDIKISEDTTTVDVGPGNRWVNVYSALAEADLYCIGGRLKTIGVSGLLLIGGFHWMNNKYGMGMDNVVSYDVVLGNGTQVAANAESNADLFWALKGGANNFGIVTKFALKTLPIANISTTIQSFNESQVEAFIKATTDMSEFDDGVIAAGSVISINYNATTKAVAASLLGVQEGTESPPSRFANFSAIPPSSPNINRIMKPIDWHNQFDTPDQMFR